MNRYSGWCIRVGFAVATFVATWSPGVRAATYNWVGPGNWSTPSNWSTNNGTTPGALDTVTVANVAACTIDISVSVASITISTSPSATVTQASGVSVAATTLSISAGKLVGSSGTVTVTGTATINGGTFTGGSGNVQIGTLNLSSGTFKSTSGLLNVTGAFSATGGTFTANGGQVMLTSTTSQTFATNSATFNNLTINDGLVGYWKVDEGTGTAIADSSGNGNDGTLQSGSTWVTSSASLPSLNFTDNAAVSLGGVDGSRRRSVELRAADRHDIGLKGETANALVSSYDDLFGNTTDYQGLNAGTGDLAAAVIFDNPAGHNYLLTRPQASTDKGDPADDVGAETMPNGARINQGAFGGTADAELSEPAAVPADSGTPAATPVTPTAALPMGSEVAGGAGEQPGGCSLIDGAPTACDWLALVVAATIAVSIGRPRRRRRV